MTKFGPIKLHSDLGQILSTLLDSFRSIPPGSIPLWIRCPRLLQHEMTGSADKITFDWLLQVRFYLLDLSRSRSVCRLTWDSDSLIFFVPETWLYSKQEVFASAFPRLHCLKTYTCSARLFGVVSVSGAVLPLEHLQHPKSKPANTRGIFSSRVTGQSK